MSVDYRSAPKGPENDVVEYRPLGKRLPWIIAVAVVVFGFVAMIFALGEATSTDVMCGRAEGGGSCVIVRTMPLLGQSNQIIPLSTILGVTIRSHRVKNGTTHQVVFLLAGSEIPLSPHGDSDLGLRQAQQRQLSAFLGDGAHPSIDMHYDLGSRWALAYLAFALVPAFVLWSIMQHVRLEFEWSLERIKHVRTRWPLRAWTRSYALDEILRARLEAKPGSKGAVNYSVVLELKDGESQPLSRVSSTSASHHEPVIAQINALLERRASQSST